MEIITGDFSSIFNWRLIYYYLFYLFINKILRFEFWMLLNNFILLINTVSNICNSHDQFRSPSPPPSTLVPSKFPYYPSANRSSSAACLHTWQLFKILQIQSTSSINASTHLAILGKYRNLISSKLFMFLSRYEENNDIYKQSEISGRWSRTICRSGSARTGNFFAHA